jgi:hypothetical protein
MKFILKKIINKRWLLCCLLFFLTACRIKSAYDSLPISKNDSIEEEREITIAFNSIHKNAMAVKQGDLIMRTGRDFTSEAMRQLSLKDKTYSHCGIASIEHDSVFVYHSIGGEWNPDQKLRRDPFIVFCNPFENRGFGIFRYNLTAKENTSLSNIIQKFYKRGIMFDMQFDLSSNERMYCSEFVYKAIEEACHERLSLPTTTINHIKFIAPDNLYINPKCSEIKRVIFSMK